MEVRNARNAECISEDELRATAYSETSVGRKSADGELPHKNFRHSQVISNDSAIGTCANYQCRQMPHRTTGPPKHLKHNSLERNDLRIEIHPGEF